MLDLHDLEWLWRARAIGHRRLGRPDTAKIYEICADEIKSATASSTMQAAIEEIEQRTSDYERRSL